MGTTQVVSDAILLAWREADAAPTGLAGGQT